MSNDEDDLASSSESESDYEEEELTLRAKQLEAELSENKYLYDHHVEVVGIYIKLNDFVSMRDAYKRFHQYFPLTPKLWLNWINGEKKACAETDKRNILFIFEKAVEDYISVDLWENYLKFVIDIGDNELTNSIIEKGLNAVGLCFHSSKFWLCVIDIEFKILSSYEKGSQDWLKQAKRVGDFYKRLLSIPIENRDYFYSTYTTWSKDIPSDLLDTKAIEWGYKNADKLYLLYKTFEDKIESAGDGETYDIYKEYIREVKDPSTVACLYERAALSNCLNIKLWEDYIRYCFEMKDVVLKVTSKALRNCPWSRDLWIMRIRAMEYHKSDEKDIVACFEEGLVNLNTAGILDLWFCLLEYHYRNTTDHTKLQKLYTLAIKSVPREQDPLHKLEIWYARITAKRGNIKEARQIWKNVISDKYFESFNAWMEYINLERQYGEIKEVRNIFKRAIKSCKQWSQYFAQEWLMFERQEGSPLDIMKCVELCEGMFEPVEESLPNETAPERQERKRTHDNNDEVISNKRKKTYHQDENKVANATPAEGLIEENLKKTSHPDKEKGANAAKPIEKDPKKTVFVSNLHPNVTEETLKELFPNALNIQLAVDKKGKSRCFGYIQFSKEEETLTALARDRIPIDGRPVFISELKSDKTRKQDFQYPTKCEENKLFVRGLPLSKTKEDVEEIFKKYNPVDVRLVFKKNGESKGIAYVEFKTKEEAALALELDSIKVDNSELKVAISAPPSKNKRETNEPIRHARSRLQVPLIPRSLQVKTNADGANKPSGSSSASKSNADFRNMFLKNS